MRQCFSAFHNNLKLWEREHQRSAHMLVPTSGITDLLVPVIKPVILYSRQVLYHLTMVPTHAITHSVQWKSFHFSED